MLPTILASHSEVSLGGNGMVPNSKTESPLSVPGSSSEAEKKKKVKELGGKIQGSLNQLCECLDDAL